MTVRPNKSPHFERLLLVVGPQNAGKSRLLRTMFLDPRFGTRSAVPDERRIRLVALSAERCLSVRCMSPHEKGDTLRRFVADIQDRMMAAYREYWRFNFACAMQPGRERRMPDIVEACEGLINAFHPERMRIVQIHPQQNDESGMLLGSDRIEQLRDLRIEIMTVDAHRSSIEHPNGLLLADFFDFT